MIRYLTIPVHDMCPARHNLPLLTPLQVVRYLEHYHNIPSFLAYGGRITDVTLDRVTFACRGHTYDTPLKPAMTSYREARERLVDMDKQCVHALGRSDITVREYTVPRGFYLALFITVCVTLVAFSRKDNFAPGGLIASLVPDAFRRFCSTIQPFLFYGMLALHGAEAVHMGRGRLSKHNVNIRAPVYWLWTADCFVEGVGAYHRSVRNAKITHN